MHDLLNQVQLFTRSSRAESTDYVLQTTHHYSTMKPTLNYRKVIWVKRYRMFPINIRKSISVMQTSSPHAAVVRQTLQNQWWLQYMQYKTPDCGVGKEL